MIPSGTPAFVRELLVAYATRPVGPGHPEFSRSHQKARPAKLIRRLIRCVAVLSLIPVLATAATLDAPPPAFPEPPIERGVDLIQNELHIARAGLRALAVAAHPDDEDGGTLSYLRRTLGVETHIVFSTRGEGGQNEIGPQLGADLAVLRTQEIEAACKILGAKPWFLNLPDFGFSKSADETLKIWGHDEALRRLVRIIRIVRPQILFSNHDPKGNDHGHHVATARLMLEAYDAADDPEKFKEDMEKDGTKIWSVSKLYVRHFTPPGATLTFDISERNPLTGLSASDIAAYALSKHSSQGMQRTQKIGEKDPRYFSLEKARPLITDSEKTLLDNLYTRQMLANDSEKTGEVSTFDYKNLDNPDSREHVMRAMFESAGLKMQCNPDVRVISAEENVTIHCVVANEGEYAVRLRNWDLVGESTAWAASNAKLDRELGPREVFEFQVKSAATEAAFPTWPMSDYIFSRIELRAPLQLRVFIEVPAAGKNIAIPLTSPVPIELAQPLATEIRPNPVLLFDDPDHGDDVSQLAKFTLAITSFRAPAPKETLTYYAGIKPVADAPVDNPAAFEFHDKGETLAQQFKFMVSNELLDKGDVLVPLNVWTEKKNFGGPSAILRRVPLRLPAPLSVALVKTVGDDVWNALKTLEATGLGLTATQLSDDDLRALDLNRFHTIVIDIRATQYRPVLRSVKARLLQFMKDGGNVVCLYQKDFDWNAPDAEHPARGTGFFRGQGGGGEIAPFPIELSFKRVTHPDAPVRMLKPEHVLLTQPCKIWEKDFAGWVQERAVYMPEKWAPQYTALLSSNDPNDAPLDGGLLAADVELGSFIYTSYVLHRELRAGVPGAYRLFANLISYPRVKKGGR